MSSTQPVRIPILVENASVEEPNKIPIERLSKATKLGPPNNNNCVQSRGWKTKVSTDDVDFVNSHMEVTLKAPSTAVALPIYNKNKDLRFLEKDYAFFVESLAPKKIPCMQKK
ncbi:unnamed protein product [Candida parapsilosis]